jgi:hypothetical protein
VGIKGGREGRSGPRLRQAGVVVHRFQPRATCQPAELKASD